MTWVGVVAVALVLAAISVASWVYWLRQQWRIWFLARRIPGPKCQSIILGNHNLLSSNPKGILRTMDKLLEEFGPVVRMWFGDHLKVILNDPDDIQQILGNSAIRNRDGDMMKFVEYMFGQGLVTIRDDKWKKHRKIVTPTFYSKLLEGFVEVFGRKAAFLTEKLKEVADGRTINISIYISSCTMDSFCETFIGTKMDSMSSGGCELVTGIFHSNSLILHRALRPWLLFDWVYELTQFGREAKKIIKLAHAFSEGVIREKLEEHRQRGPDNNKKQSAFLDVLIHELETEGSVFTANDLRDEVTQMTTAGVGTTAVTISTLLMLLAQNPEIQDEIQQELHEVFGPDSRPASWEDLHSLPVLDRCIKETLRLFPIGVNLIRDIPMDLHIPSGYILPAGCSVQMFTYTLHRNPRYYPSPNKFWPNRWLPENTVDPHPYAYLPYSAGHRNCIGQRYAQLQIKSILCKVLREFRVDTDVDIDFMIENLEMSMVLCMKEEVGYPVRLTPRN